MSAVSSCSSTSSCNSPSELDKLRQSTLDKLKGDDKASGLGKVEDIVDVARRDDDRVAAAAKSDFGTSFDQLAPGQRLDVTA
jgi:hypothetical protein